MAKILIVVDMQNDFIDGALGSSEAVAIVPYVKQKIESFEGKVFFTRDTHFENYLKTNEGKHLPVEHCIENTHGWNIIEELDVVECEHINKTSFGHPYWDIIKDSESILARFLGEIEIVGVCTDICVVSNALILKALYPEINITVDASCCAGVTPESHQAALTTMKMCQINVIGE